MNARSFCGLLVYVCFIFDGAVLRGDGPAPAPDKPGASQSPPLVPKKPAESTDPREGAEPPSGPPPAPKPKEAVPPPVGLPEAVPATEEKTPPPPADSPSPSIADELRSIRNSLSELQGEVASLRGHVRSLPVGGAGYFAAAAAPVAPAPATTPAARIHVLLIGDTGDVGGIGVGARANLSLMSSLIRHQSKGQADIQTLEGPDVTVANVRARIAGFTVGASDTLLCYVSCHGAFATGNGQHFFQIPANGANLPRSELRSLLTGKGARHTVLLSDSCSPAQNVSVMASAYSASAAQNATHALFYVLYYGTGTVDINASSPPSAVPGFDPDDPNGQLAIYRLAPRPEDGGGGFFTRAFWGAALFADPSRGWEGIFENTRDATRDTFSKFPIQQRQAVAPGQRNQTPFRFR